MILNDLHRSISNPGELKIVRGVTRTIEISGYPSLSSVENGSVPNGEK